MGSSLEDFLKDLGKAKEEVRNFATGPVNEVALQWAKEVVENGQAIMKGSGRDASGVLSQSLEPQMIIEDEGAFKIQILAEEYWDFIDSGVDGVNESAGATENAEGKIQKFKYVNPSKKHVAAMSGGNMQNWLASRGVKQLSWIDKETGEQVIKNLVTDSDYKGAAYVLARGTKRNGIEPNHFLSSQLTEEHIEKLTDKLTDEIEKLF